MKTIAFTIIAIFLSIGTYAQEKKEIRKEERTEKDSIIARQYRQTENMLDSMNFVLEADYLQDKYGNRVPVTSGLNFIMVDSSRAVIQTGRNSGMGYNGVGGATAEGSVSNWKLNKNDKNKTFTVSMDVMSDVGVYNIFMDISADGRATATLSGLGPGKLSWEGFLTSIEHSGTYEGRSF